MMVKSEIPSDWKIIQLGRFADVKRGLASQNLLYVEGQNLGVRLLRINDFKSKNHKYIKETKITKQLTVEENDILIAGTGATAGITFFITAELSGLPFSYNAPRIRVIKNLNPQFLYYFLNTEIIQNQQNRLFTGNAQPFLDTKAIKSFKIPIPPLLEQQKIADILSTVDEKIEIIDQQILETEKLKKGLMQRLFAKGIGHTEFKNSPLGKIPKSWGAKKIGDITKTFAGGTPKRNNPEYFSGGTIPWVKSGEVSRRFVDSTEELVTEIALKESSARVIPEDSLLIAMYGATAGQVGILKISACSNQAVLAVVPSQNGFSIPYLYYYLSEATPNLLRMVQGSGQPNLSKGIVDSLYVPLPSSLEQKKISAILDCVSDKWANLSKKKKEYQQLKKALMQQLLTGKVRVNIPIEA